MQKKVAPYEAFLWETEPKLTVNENHFVYLLNEGYFTSKTKASKKLCPPAFQDLMRFLEEVWEKFSKRYLLDQDLRLGLHDKIYSLLIDRSSSSLFDAGAYQEGIVRVFEKYKSHLLAKWQADRSIVSPSELKSYSTTDWMHSSFLHFWARKPRNELRLAITRRIYLHVHPHYLPSLLDYIVKTFFIESPQWIDHFKIPNAQEVSKRLDSVILYLDKEESLQSILSGLHRYYSQFPHHFQKYGPLMTKEAFPGAYTCEQPHFGFEKGNFKYWKFDRSLMQTIWEKLGEMHFPTAEKHQKLIPIFGQWRSEIGASLEASTEGDWVPAVTIPPEARACLRYFEHAPTKEMDALEQRALFTRNTGNIYPEEKTMSFSKLRTNLIADALHLCYDRTFEDFVVQVWWNFQQAKINFFNPSENLPEEPEAES